jgi:hypothetical protein
MEAGVFISRRLSGRRRPGPHIFLRAQAGSGDAAAAAARVAGPGRWARPMGAADGRGGGWARRWSAALSLVLTLCLAADWVV